MRHLNILTSLLLLFFLKSISTAFAQLPPPFVYQSLGGYDLQVVHRQDISDSTYELRYRTFRPCQNCAGAGGYFFNTTDGLYTVHDSCNPGVLALQPWLISQANLTLQNPISGDSAAHLVFRTCAPGVTNFITGNFLLPGTILAGFQDTFAIIREYHYSKIITLPNACGLWQVLPMAGSNFQCVAAQTSNTMIDHQFGTNLDSTDYFAWPGNPAVGIPYSCRAIAQINSLFPNSNPYFLSYPVAHYPKGVPVKFKQNAVDPDGDSLVWSSLHMLMIDTVHGIKPPSFWAPFVPQKECPNAPYLNLPNSPVSTGMKKVPGYECIPGTGTFPNCIRYDPVYNPFDTDSTYFLDPHTGDITFTAQSAPQTARLLLRCDEYRNGVWVGSVNRRVDFFITDSMYYSEPALNIDTPALVNCYLDSPYVFYACRNQALSLPFWVKAASNQSYLLLSDNHAFSIPGSSLTYQNNASDSVRGTLQWIPGFNDTGWHQILVKVFDSACAVSPYIREYDYVLRIYVSSGLQLSATDTTLCAGASVQLSATGLGNNVSWSILSGTPGSLSCTTCAKPWATPTQTSVYLAAGSTTGLNCVMSDTVTVKVVQDFSLNATDTTVCSTAQVMLQAHATGQNTPLQYQWLPTAGIIGGNNNSFILISPANTQYIVSATDTLGCFIHSDTSTVVYDTTFKPVLLMDQNGICTGDTVSLSVLGGGTITWSPNYHISALTGAGVLVWPDTSMVYTATVEANGLPCSAELSAEVKVTALRADAGPDREVFDGEPVYLGGPDMLCGDGCQVQWFPDKWMFFNFMLFPKVVPHVTTTYWVLLRNETGACTDRDSVTVRVKCTDVYMPNVFNPESLGGEYTRNFGPRNVSLDLDYFRIFNRWGEMVFETRDVGYRWDGTYKGRPQPVGNYVWILRGRCPNGETMEKKGNVLLVR